MIVIVGAGLAGLSAAWKLTQANCKEFIVVEAQSRAGGRIQSIYHVDGCRLDLGAQWLHGQHENPIYEWLKSIDCIEGPEDEEVEFEGLFATQHGRQAPPPVVSRVLELLLEAKSQLYKLSPMLDDKKCKPIDTFRNCVQLEMSKCPVLKSAGPRLVQAVLRWFELYEMIDNSCEDMSLLSIRAYSEWSDFDNGQMVKLKGGWQKVVDKMIEAIGQDKILLDCPVQQISYSNNGAHVRLSSGRLIHCDHVIVTLSVGVLRELVQGATGFFVPPLDERKRAGVMNWGFGPANKIFLEFEEPYLRAERGVKFLWLPSSGKDDHLEADEEDTTRMLLPNWARYVTGFDLVNGAPDCLLAWVGGVGAIEVESYSDEEVAETCLKLLKMFLPLDKQPAPKLVSITRSNWAKNPFIKGAYSYQSSALADQDTSLLWEPVYCGSSGAVASPRVLFAGEATAGRMYATGHGAIVSGWREADRLLKYCENVE